MSKYLIAAVLIVLGGYGFFKAFPLLSGPAISIESPAPYSAASGGDLVLTGVAKRTETLTLNDGVLLIDSGGHFSTSLTLPQGGAILSLTARDRFGRSVTKRVTVTSL
ncbi:MAG: hypothetical protein AAB883_03085 [Patescibacteria group bacterium]